MPHEPTLTTARLRLRALALDDAPDVQRLAGDRAIAATTSSIPHPYEDGMAEAWITQHAERYASGESAAFAATRRADGAFLGMVGLELNAEQRRAELGYWIGKPYWNQGYATEAAAAATRFALTELELRRVFAFHFGNNPASGRVMQKIGMRHEGTLRQHILKWGEVIDLEVYGMLAEELSGAPPAAPQGRFP